MSERPDDAHSDRDDARRLDSCSAATANLVLKRLDEAALSTLLIAMPEGDGHYLLDMVEQLQALLDIANWSTTGARSGAG